MASISKLTPGMTVYDVSRQKMGNTNMSTVVVWRVTIISVDTERKRVTASWNGNAPRVYGERVAKSWRVKEPVLVKSGWGHRLATRAELKALKEKP